MPSGGTAGRKKASGRAASGKAAAAAAATAADTGVMHAPAARMPSHVGLSGGAAGFGVGALSGSSCAVGRAVGRGPRSGAAMRPVSVKAEPEASAPAAAADAAAAEEEEQQEAASAEAQLGVTSDGDVDVDDKENAAGCDAAGAEKGVGGRAFTAVSSAGVGLATGNGTGLEPAQQLCRSAFAMLS